MTPVDCPRTPTHPSCPLYLSSPFFHQTARNQTYTQGFFPFLSVLLKTFNVTNCLSECVGGCVRAFEDDERVSSAGEH